MEIDAPPQWRCVDFISDLHLQGSDHQTFDAWREYLLATPADAVFILGDLFEVWVGDDVVRQPASFEAQCTQVIRQAACKTRVFIMQGNRDFLMGPALMQACDAELLSDPTVLGFGGQRWLLSHGDALCLADVPYQQFRTTVRNSAWQREFLSKSLEERQTLARGIRMQSEARKNSHTPEVDLDTTAVKAWLETYRADHMIHGHTHRPGVHLLDHRHQRIVLSDWDVRAQPPRAEVLRIRKEARNTCAVTRMTPASATKPLD